MAESKNTSNRDEARIAQRYFSSFADDYHRAFERSAGSRSPLHGLINRLFRRATFQKRTEIVRRLLQEHGISGKRVLELGCGSGEVSILAAKMGARVTGFDIVEDMIAIARQQAAAAGVADRAEFQVADIVSADLPRADVTMIVAVIEYYGDPALILRKACASAGEMLLVVDARGPWWRRTLRRVLARAKHFHLYYHKPAAVAGIVEDEGFVRQASVPGHSYTVMAFRRPQVRAVRG